jgi:hypothetical protein
MNQLYKQHFEDMQRVNQQWLNLFWKPFMGPTAKTGRRKEVRMIRLKVL